MPPDDAPRPPAFSRKELARLLAWHKAMGADTAVNETPVDRFLEADEPGTSLIGDAPGPLMRATPVNPGPLIPPPATASRAGPPPPKSPPVIRAPAAQAVSVEEAESEARAAAGRAQTLDELREALVRFEGCGLRLTATNLVFADGTPGSRVMLVGEAPGRDEDLAGLPFVGRSGQLLDRMLAAIGLSRREVYFANIVPWRPPGNRTPTPQEAAACRPFIQRQIELADPDFLVCLGGSATKELFGASEGILRLRGRWRDYDTGRRTIRALATLHPAYLLRQPLQKRLAWRDLLLLKQALAD